MFQKTNSCVISGKKEQTLMSAASCVKLVHTDINLMKWSWNYHSVLLSGVPSSPLHTTIQSSFCFKTLCLLSIVLSNTKGEEGVGTRRIRKELVQCVIVVKADV